MRTRNLFVRFTKIDEEKREVAGRLTQEVVDRDGEIWDYASSVPHVKAWSQGFDEATDGKSVGNLRAMHQPISAGKLTSIEFNDADKAVDIVAKVVDDAEWEKTKEGVYTGFSIGGNVVRSWRDPQNTKYKRFEVKPIEASLADLPCVPTATFSYVKLGGTVETRRFKKVAEPIAHEYADPDGKRLPIFSKTMTRATLALWGAPQVRAPYDEKTQETIGRRIRKAAESFGLPTVTEKAMLRGDFQKGLYDVGQLATLVQSLAWLQQNAKWERDSEGDDSTVPDQLTDAVAGLLDTLEAMLGEEGDELLRMLRPDDAGATSTKEAVTMDEKSETSQKVAATAADFQKLAAKHVEKLAGIHTAMKAAHTMLGDACEKIAGFTDEVAGESTTKVASADTEKVAKADFEKVLGERNEFEKRFNQAVAERDAAVAERDTFKKTAEELAESGEQLLGAVTVRKGTLVAVDRGADGQAGLKTEKVEKVAAAEAPAGQTEQVDRTKLHQSFKAAFSKPRIETGMPEAATA